ncbi:hypothetical protein [Nocardioides sp. CER19]|uniref:hypothetical protein n=1 Tax=Nocardioides sp. CER19 TaxID=3038538 RepID=UPI0024495754|nr:hypothetical protein [Nocardioides sp. CER19]MDH2413836.1 hypothetical protein [Nocardioides sp. CER19]
MSLKHLPAFVPLAVTAVFGLSACSSDTGTPDSAKDVAKRAGCSDIHAAEVPAAWATYDEAVTCVLDGAQVKVYWSTNDQAQECLDGGDAKCAEALRAFRPTS